MSLIVQQKRHEHKYLATVLYQKRVLVNKNSVLVVTTSERMACYAYSTPIINVKLLFKTENVTKIILFKLIYRFDSFLDLTLLRVLIE